MKQNLLLKGQLLVIFLLMSLGGLFAQITVSGLISDDTGEGLIGVSILLKGSTIGTITDLDGSFSLVVPNNNGILEISYLGYKSESFAISADDNYFEVAMVPDLNQLDEIVVTGLATTIKRSNTANSVARVDAAALTGVTPQATVDGALYGKFKGAEIRASSGAPGGGISFKLRGTTSINGSSQPLIILDGVYIDNSSIPAGLNVVSAASSGGSTSNQDNPSNRLADIDPGDIESVEILKGASAAAIYGSRAAGGVVIINTKRGTASGETEITIAQSVGQSSMLRPLGIRQWTDERVLASNFAGDIDNYRAAVSNGTVRNYEDLLYGNKG
ncbi:MAG: TonB-dependent SusC/RagA subfamily outer membrane receptor, partial [Saprospiraceae bacterium]